MLADPQVDGSKKSCSDPYCPLSPPSEHVSQTFDDHIDFVPRRCAPEAEPYGAHPDLWRNAHSYENR